MRIKELFEAPLPGDWDKSKFSPQTSFRAMVAYAKERAEQIGRGSSRVVFQIPYQGRVTALKIALNRKGIVQDQEEASLLSDWSGRQSGITIPVIDYDEENGSHISWIHTEFAEKISKKQLESYFGGVSMGSIIANIEYQKTGRKTYMYRDLPENVLEIGRASCRERV